MHLGESHCSVHIVPILPFDIYLDLDAAARYLFIVMDTMIERPHMKGPGRWCSSSSPRQQAAKSSMKKKEVILELSTCIVTKRDNCHCGPGAAQLDAWCWELNPLVDINSVAAADVAVQKANHPTGLAS